MKQAVFSLKNYSVVNVMLDLENIPPQCIFDLKIEPSGIYFQRERQYVLNLVFKASYKKENTDFEVINIKLKAVFSFGDMVQTDNIPPYFYANSIAIIFPYVRAFVSTITLQANVAPIMIPTLNVSLLEHELRRNTVLK